MKIDFINPPSKQNYYEHFNNIFSNKSRAVSKSGAVSFTGATEVFAKNFIKTQKEIEEVFQKNPESDWIAGTLPESWLAKLKDYPENERNIVIKKVMLAFRSAIKHLKPYNAPEYSKDFNQHKKKLENKRVKESSTYLTKALRHFGILPETNSIGFKKRKVHGKYINRGYVLKEKGKAPSLEKLFIKTFKHTNPELLEANFNGVKAETAHGLNINELNCKYISKIYWGDIKGNFMASEYATPPKHIGPIVRFKSSYQTLQDFSKDFLRQTGIEVTELINRDIRPGSTNRKGRYVPRPKDEIIIEYLQSELNNAGLAHYDLHKDNAVIGTDENGKAIVKIIDLGGVATRN